MKNNGMQGFWIIWTGVVAVLLTTGLRAEDGAQAARLSSVDGQVRLLQGNQVLAETAIANTPIFEGTQVVTDGEGRAEVQFQDGSLARISPDSSMTISVLRGQGNGAETEIAMEGGLGYFELQSPDQSGNLRVKFGNNVVTASGFTVLRINLDNAPGELAVFAGNAHLEIGNVEHGLALDLHGGESVALNGVDPTRYRFSESIEPDSWDSWNADRDQALTAQSTARTAASESLDNGRNPALGDLDANGNWYNVPGQGFVWSPYEGASAGWDPYGSGNWMWTPRFGYIWVSGYSWGYMPFQCGAWNFYDGFGWGWAPGMGGCNPWWNGGYYQPNIGTAYGGYIPPLRPHFPIHGRGGGGGRNGPHPLIAVNRLPNRGGGQAVVAQRNTPLVIGGQRVMPLRPLPMGEQARRSESGFLNSPRPTYSQRDASPSGNWRQVFGRDGAGNTVQRPGYASQQGNARTANGNGFNGSSGFSGAGHWTAPSAGSHAYANGGGNSGGSRGAGASSGGGGSHSGGGSSGGGFSSGGGGGGSHGGGGGAPASSGGGSSAPSGGGSHR